MTVLWILGAIFLCLIVVVPLVERFSSPQSNESMAKMSRYIFPLIMILLVGQLIMHLMRG